MRIACHLNQKKITCIFNESGISVLLSYLVLSNHEALAKKLVYVLKPFLLEYSFRM
ncbi:hypothetical protein CHU_1114 [Cytophaga hutchinsonii ATCC 33406]|uniref:Uncharacterized protein n=1 Tax=Cytophaga hutchinsonii (strain ATCC 33406 / DSM 1761 / CIP 103989 / NBRC 15051 / NCIMB 9469 / D465) TaxID=269798 RepID=A0A6N4SQ33_CYTH3|nr:hypothetical protein CHU_1114 [Cytophaga hutchinsonii ATCC 33406]